MNANKYVENPNMARKIVFIEAFEYVQAYLNFYRDSRGFTKYDKDDFKTIHKAGRKRWQNIINSVNANAVYYGDYYYTKILKKMITNDEKKEIPTINEWIELYPELMDAYKKMEQNTSEESFDELFMDYFNELQIASNKELMKINI